MQRLRLRLPDHGEVKVGGQLVMKFGEEFFIVTYIANTDIFSFNNKEILLYR